jgi:hypothetical protein
LSFTSALESYIQEGEAALESGVNQTEGLLNMYGGDIAAGVAQA